MRLAKQVFTLRVLKFGIWRYLKPAKNQGVKLNTLAASIAVHKMESIILNRIQQTTSRVKNVLEDSDKLLAELKARRPVAQVIESDDDQQYEADDESEYGQGDQEEQVNEVQEVIDEDEDEDEGLYTFFCCRARRGLETLLL